MCTVTPLKRHGSTVTIVPIPDFSVLTFLQSYMSLPEKYIYEVLHSTVNLCQHLVT
jgi:hypothetical protein